MDAKVHINRPKNRRQDQLFRGLESMMISFLFSDNGLFIKDFWLFSKKELEITAILLNGKWDLTKVYK